MLILIALIVLSASASSAAGESNYIGKLHPDEAYYINCDSKNSFSGDGKQTLSITRGGDDVGCRPYETRPFVELRENHFLHF